jgi:predicted Zn-dependent protease
MKKLILYTFAAAALASLFGCVKNPVTGKRQIVLVSEAQEIAMGQQADPEVRQEYGVAEGDALQGYLKTLGRKLARVSHRPNLEWEFTVVDSPVVNAFAIPGGYVYVTRGILAYLGNEAELAGVVGHEIGHVTARHSVRQITRQELAQMGLGVGGALSPALGQLGDAAQNGIGLVFLRFSREDEREADRLGVEYAARASYDPRQVSNFFEVLGRLSSANDRETTPGFLSTHPDPPERVQTTRDVAQKWIQDLGIPEERMNLNREQFLRALDGMVFGNNPREGFADGRRFYHPVLQFQIEFPAGWHIDNTREAVVASEPQRQARMQLSFAKVRRGTTPEEYVRALAARGLPARNERSIRIHGYNAVLAVYSGAIAGFIEFRDQIVQIIGVAQNSGRFSEAMEDAIRSFDKLSDQRIMDAQPDRLRIYSAREGDTLVSIARKFDNPRVASDDLAVLNRMAAEQPITPGRLIKVVEKGY